jgi:hypothetical protein
VPYVEDVYVGRRDIYRLLANFLSLAKLSVGETWKEVKFHGAKNSQDAFIMHLKRTENTSE